MTLILGFIRHREKNVVKFIQYLKQVNPKCNTASSTGIIFLQHIVTNIIEVTNSPHAFLSLNGHYLTKRYGSLACIFALRLHLAFLHLLRLTSLEVAQLACLWQAQTVQLPDATLRLESARNCSQSLRAKNANSLPNHPISFLIKAIFPIDF